MRVIVIGAGEVGYQIAKFLSLESSEIIVIDKDKEKLNRLSKYVDVAVIEGEGGTPSILQEAEADKADILLAVTDRDETNMIACLLAKAMFGIPRKIARIRNLEYFNNGKLLSSENLDIHPAINPELEISKAIIRLLKLPFAMDVIDFEEGHIKVIGLKIPDNSPLINKSLENLKKSLNKNFLIGFLLRGEKTLIPSGNDVIKKGDIIYIPVKNEEVENMADLLGIKTKPVKKIMVLGGGHVGYHIASAIEDKADVKIIEKNEKRCKFLSQNLKKTLILCADGQEKKVLLEENIGNMDAFVAVSNNDELNIMVSLLAKNHGAKKTIAIVNKTDYMTFVQSLGLHAVLSPRLTTVSTILRYIRRGDILSLTKIADAKAEIIEARIGETLPIVGKTLRKIKLKASLIGAIIRGEKIIIPSGSDRIFEGDKLIIFTGRDTVKEVEKILV